MKMLAVYMFWIWALGSSCVMLLAARSRYKNLAFFLYGPLMIAAFSASTLVAVQSYMRAALQGNTDSAIGLFIHQAYINPIVRLAFGLGLEELVHFPIHDLPSPSTGSPIAVAMSFQLWEVMVADLLLGNVFWLIFCTFWLQVVERGVRRSGTMVARLRSRKK